MSYKIRFMRKEDLQQVGEIDKEAFPTQWPPTNYRGELQNRLAHYMVVFEEGTPVKNSSVVGINKPGFLTRIKRILGVRESQQEAKPEDMIVGFAGCWIMADEDHITEIAVRATHRQQGIAHLLLISLIELGKRYKANLATLEVRTSNTPAQELYEKFGFEKVGTRKAYYSDNKEDALIMTTPDINSPQYREKLEQLKQCLAVKWKLPVVPGVTGIDNATR